MLLVQGSTNIFPSYFRLFSKNIRKNMMYLCVYIYMYACPCMWVCVSVCQSMCMCIYVRSFSFHIFHLLLMISIQPTLLSFTFYFSCTSRRTTEVCVNKGRYCCWTEVDEEEMKERKDGKWKPENKESGREFVVGKEWKRAESGKNELKWMRDKMTEGLNILNCEWNKNVQNDRTKLTRFDR